MQIRERVSEMVNAGRKGVAQRMQRGSGEWVFLSSPSPLA